jgi:hypothetical protein
VKAIHWHLNVTAKMVGYLLVASLVPLVLLGFSAFEISKRIVVEQAESQNARLLGGFTSYFKLYDDQINDMAANIAGNEAIGLSLRRADEGQVNAFDRLEMRSNMGRLLNSYVRVKGLVSIDVFSLGGLHFHVGETLNVSEVSLAQITQLLQEALASKAPTLWRGVNDNLNTGSQQRKVISVVRAIKYYSAQTGNSDTVGLLVINLNDEIMRTYLQGGAVGGRYATVPVGSQWPYCVALRSTAVWPALDACTFRFGARYQQRAAVHAGRRGRADERLRSRRAAARARLHHAAQVADAKGQ